MPAATRNVLLTCVLLVGCGTMSGTVQERAENEFSCSNVDVENVGGQTFTASGCGRTATFTCVRGTTWGVACEHDDATTSSSSTTSSTPPPATTTASAPLRRPPAGVAGFAFGISAAEAKTVCEGAGHTFAVKDAMAACDGFAVDLGIPGGIKLRFCNGKLCVATLVMERAGGTLEDSVLHWKRAIAEKYGNQTENRSNVPGGCGTLAQCVSSHSATVDVAWVWPTHESIELRVPARDNPDEERVEIAYDSGQQPAVSGL